MIDRIVLDLDGVCNRFVYHAFQRLGLDATEKDYPVECGWDIVYAINTLTGERYSSKEFWTSLDRDFWSSIPVSDEFEPLLNWAEQAVGMDNVHFLSASSLDPDSLAGKLEWIYANAPRWMHRHYLIGPSKTLCANESILLIDDRDKNVSDFIHAGGHARLMPRPWNSLYGRDPLVVLGEINASS
jgi:5'(3')-deoxyribonucleotidase